MYPFVRCCRMLFANADVDERFEMITMIIKTGGFDDIIKEDVTTTYPFVRGWRMLNQQI